MKKPLEGFVGDDLLWKLTKDYNIRTFDDNKGSFGHAVDVYIPTIGTTNKEFLVPYAYFQKLAKEYGLEVVEINGFGKVFENVPKDSKYYNAIHEMSDAEKQFSFLNNQFKFVKKENTSDKTYKKLIELMQKEEKKAKKETKGGNSKIRIVIRSENKNKSMSPKRMSSPPPKKTGNIKVINLESNVKNIKIK